MITLNAAILCCKAPRTAFWIWRSINKISIIIIIIISQRSHVFDFIFPSSSSLACPIIRGRRHS